MIAMPLHSAGSCSYAAFCACGLLFLFSSSSTLEAFNLGIHLSMVMFSAYLF